jgi:hypothetical protein
MIEVYLFTIVIVGLLWGWLIGHAKGDNIVIYSRGYTPSWGNFPKEEE